MPVKHHAAMEQTYTAEEPIGEFWKLLAATYRRVLILFVLALKSGFIGTSLKDRTFGQKVSATALLCHYSSPFLKINPRKAHSPGVL
jgi:hypothetical protein